MALGAGGGIALLLSLINPIVVDARMRAESTGLPLLGVVTWNKANEERRRDWVSLASFAAGVVLLVGAFGAVLLAPDIVERLTSA